ncbi:zf-HC2 domain-containing protein [Nocardia sp. NBC_01377]|uniref:zf-HC2 domain-containing protein n=1 Tax=Nocardia sp. NBC_01377 TaxID=2903595 RepID=UPI0032455743
MECETAREAASALLDGEQAAVPTTRLHAHIERCPACRTWRDLLTGIDAAHGAGSPPDVRAPSAAPADDVAITRPRGRAIGSGRYHAGTSIVHLALSVEVALLMVATGLPPLIASIGTPVALALSVATQWVLRTRAAPARPEDLDLAIALPPRAVPGRTRPRVVPAPGTARRTR